MLQRVGLCLFYVASIMLVTLSPVAFGQIPVPPAGRMATAAGTGTAGFSGDEGLATSAELGVVAGIAVDGSGNLYFADTINNRVRRIDARSGIVTTFAGNGSGGVFGKNGNWGDGGLATNAIVNQPIGIAVDAAGSIYITDPRNSLVRKVAAKSGIITTVAGTVGEATSGISQLATNFSLKTPCGVAVDSAGNIYIADSGANLILRVDANTGMISRIAGTGTAGYRGDNDSATLADLNSPTALAVDAAGNIYVADYGNNAIRKVSASSGVITTLAGDGTAGFAGDGEPAGVALLSLPEYVAVDSLGNIYFDDYQNSVIRKISASTGVISTIAGTGIAGYSGDGGPATSEELSMPFGVAIDDTGYLYIADTANYRIRVVDAGPGSGSTAYLTITSSDPQPAMNESITLTARIVDDSNAPVTSGIVTWFNGNDAIGQGSVDSSGVTTQVASLGPGGDQFITARFAGTVLGAGTLVLHVSGFSIVGPANANVSVPSGQTATFSLSAKAFYGFKGIADLSCSGIPAPGACSLSLNRVNLNANASNTNVILSVATAQSATSAAKRTPGIPSGLFLATLFPIALVGIKRRSYDWKVLALLIYGICVMGGIGGCASMTTPQTTAAASYLPAGTYTVTVAANSGSNTIQVPITVTVE